jgi:LuxR family transcriptional regulator, maltose regulon positive regulatory protein
MERLEQGSRGPLTLVAAAAGYGKTTLVSSWIESFVAANDAAHRPVAWISLDERDSDLGLFLRYVISGVHTMFPGACADTFGLIQSTRPPAFDLLCMTFVNEIAAIPQDFILVLDDCHLIGGTDVPDLLSELARHWPQPLHLVLISRYVPALALSTLRAKGQLTEIRARDLRFTPAESAAYLEMALSAPLSQPAFEALESRTEGWIAGLQLASLSLRDLEDPERLLNSLSNLDTEFAGFLANDVLAHQPAPILSFLLQTAILNSFNVALCEAVIASEVPEWSARRCIDWLEERNLFITSLDGHSEWYRYHQIFRSVLLERATAELGPQRVSALQHRAADWYAQHGLVDEAVRHALAAGDRELAARCIAQGLCDVLNHEDCPTLDRWLGLFVPEFIEERADLLIVRGFSLFLSWQLGALASVVARAAVLLEGEISTTLPEVELETLRGCVAVLAAVGVYFSSDPSSARTYGSEALACLPQAWEFVRGGGRLFQVLAMQADGQGQTAVRLLTEDYESRHDRASTYSLRLLQALCFISYRQAEDLERMIQTAQKLVAAAEHKKLHLLLSWGHYFIGLAHYQRDELPAARQSFIRLLDYKNTGNIGALRDGVQRLALIHQLADEQAEAWRMLQFLSQLDLEQTGREWDETSALRARLWLMRGDLASAARWADNFTAPVPDQPWIWQDPPHLIKARILITRGLAADLRSAQEILDSLFAVAERNHNRRLQIEVMALRALALAAEGQAPAARDALQAAVNLAQPGGFVRVFVDLGLRTNETDSFLSSQAANDGATDALEHDLPPLVEPLTARELEVLALLREPVSLKEIAGRLFISYLTVRRHTANIYGKLGVNRRQAAVARAKAMGLLPRR